MDKVFLETSIFIRYFTADDKKKLGDCVHLLELIEKGAKIRPYTSNIVLLEILFVLTRVYEFSKKEVLEAIFKILGLRNLTLIEKTNTRAAMKTFRRLNIKYADCLIATQVPKNSKIITYDVDFSKIKTVAFATPEEFS
ncbi:PIN domain-containing protein [Candidatus Curtissbacteria bacterium]|nr:PIN domain-containing protein [Candidatus Curtissbacteria bacterium]